MPFTDLTIKSIGGNISRAEAVDLLDNLLWFYIPPSYRLYSTGGETVTSTFATMDYAPPNFHPEWREGGAGVPNVVTYHSGTDGLYVNVGDVADGVWLNGVMFAIEQPTTAGSTAVRRVAIERGTGAVWTEMADTNVNANMTARRTSVHIFGAGTFSASTDRVRVRARTAGVDLDVLLDRRWGCRLGSATNYTAEYAAARPVSDANGEVIRSWNQLRTNQYRIERRPSAQIWKDGPTDLITSSGVVHTLTMPGSDWASDAGMTATANRLTIEHSGVYLVSSQVSFAELDSGESFATVGIQSDGSTNVVTANVQDQGATSEEDTVATVCDLVPFDAGQYLETTVVTGVSFAVPRNNRGTQMHATLMSSSSGVSPNRQVFARMPDPDTWPDVAAMSSAHLTAGTLRVISDLTDRQWHVPAFKARLVDDVEVDAGGGWTDVDCEEQVFDYTGLQSTHGVTVFANGGLVLPWRGTWLVGARLSFSSRTAEGTPRGAGGIRAMRLAYGRKRASGAIIGTGMNNSNHGWTRTLCEEIVTNRDEVEVKVQGLVNSLVEDFGAAVVREAHIWAVERGEGVTRVPR